MTKRCINPDCGNEFRQLHRGDLYALEMAAADTRFVWLCEECGRQMAVVVDAGGTVSVRGYDDHRRATPAGSRTSLRLISGCRPAWRSPGAVAAA
jgi:hypothetical protein